MVVTVNPGALEQLPTVEVPDTHGNTTWSVKEIAIDDKTYHIRLSYDGFGRVMIKGDDQTEGILISANILRFKHRTI